MNVEECLKTFDESHKAAKHAIRNILESDDEVRFTPGFKRLIKAIMSSGLNPSSFLPEGWKGSFSSAQDFRGLVQVLDHALHDDGDVTFFTVRGEPRFGFFDRHSAGDEKFLEKSEILFKTTRGSKYAIEVLSLEDWLDLFEGEDVREVKRQFIGNSIQVGVEQATVYAKSSALFNPDWPNDPAILKEIAEKKKAREAALAKACNVYKI